MGNNSSYRGRDLRNLGQRLNSWSANGKSGERIERIAKSVVHVRVVRADTSLHVQVCIVTYLFELRTVRRNAYICSYYRSFTYIHIDI